MVIRTRIKEPASKHQHLSKGSKAPASKGVYQRIRIGVDLIYLAAAPRRFCSSPLT